MEKNLIRVSYLVGLVCTAAAVILRGLGWLGVWRAALEASPWHLTFYKGALLFFVMAIATASYAGAQAQK